MRKRGVFALCALNLLAGATGWAAAPAGDAALPSYVAQTEAAGELRVSGADTMQALMEDWGRTFQQRHPRAALRVTHDTKLSAEGFTALLEGQADVVTFVREPFRAEQQGFEQKFGYPMRVVNVAGGSYATQSGTHAIAIYVNAGNPLRGLTLAQLDAVFSKTLRRGAMQTITTWGQLGLTGEWAQRPVHVYGMLRQRGSGNPPGIVNYLSDAMLAGGDWRDDLREQVDRPGEPALHAIVHRVAEDPLGIGYSGFAYGAPGAKTLALARTGQGPFYAGTAAEVASRDYPLSRRIYLGFNVPPGQPLSALQREFLRFVLSREGQQAVAADHMHFIPLNAQQAAAARAQLD
jgi:phosphate transport system substrate-binding protein